VNAELFNKSQHAKIFVQMGTPGCVTCHSNHDIKPTNDGMLGVGANTICSTCHTANDTGGKTAMAMRESIDTLRTDYDTAHTILINAEHDGMEVSQIFFDLDGAKSALIKARASIHGFNLAGVKAQVQPGLEIAQKARIRGLRALDELRFRREGLVISVLIILALIVGLVMKIRRLEQKS
jgi:predicted CXXCH cytochrome family protein